MVHATKRQGGFALRLKKPRLSALLIVVMVNGFKAKRIVTMEIQTIPMVVRMTAPSTQAMSVFIQTTLIPQFAPSSVVMERLTLPTSVKVATMVTWMMMMGALRHVKLS